MTPADSVLTGPGASVRGTAIPGGPVGGGALRVSSIVTVGSRRLRVVRLALACALVYALLGAGGLLLAIPPGYASPVFPAAGFALAAMLHHKRRVLPGIWAGSTLLNVGHAWLGGHLGPATLLVAALIGLGATAQAWAGSWLVRRWQGPAWRALELEQDAFRFLLLGGVLAGLVSASVGAGALVALGVVHVAEAAFTWWNWYVGDVLGVLVFAPLAFCFLKRRSPVWRERLHSIVLPVLLTLALVVLAFYGAARWDAQTQATRLHEDGAAIAKGIADRLIAHREILASLRRFVEATPDFSFKQFEQFTRITLQDNPDIFALSFNDLVRDPERTDFERRMSSLSPLGQFQITERDSERQLVRARQRPEYVTVRYIVPLARNRPAVGYDINSESIRRAAIERARASGTMAVTAPVLLVQEQQDRVGLLELLPVIDPTGLSVPGGGQIVGFAVAVIKVDEMIAIATRDRVPQGLEFALIDTEAPADRGLLYRSTAPVASPSPVPTSVVDWSTPLRMGDRDWLLAVSTTAGYRQQQRPWLAWIVGVAGLLFATLLQVLFLGMTGRSAVIQRKNAQLQLAEKVFNSSGEAIVVTDPAARVLSTNPTFTRVTGYSAAEMRGRNMRVLKSGRQSPDFYRDLWHRLLDEGQWQGEIWNRRKGGQVYPEWLTISAVRNDAGQVTQYVGTFSDITEPKAAQEQIEFLAFHDPLTRLPNRALGLDRIGQAIAHARRRDGRMALLLMDLDRFKLVNDSWGHSTGDALLQAVAERLRADVRQEDTLCRLSGDEFLIVLYEAGSNPAIASKCNQILRDLSRPFTLPERSVSTACSIGVAIFPRDGDNAETLLRNADTALYEAKKQGRNTHRFFDAQMNLDVVHYVETRDALEGALARDELEIYYQPLVCTHPEPGASPICAAEALLRWHHPQRGLVPPTEFIGFAEESGLILPIGAWLLRAACQQARQWQLAGLALPVVAVNLSALQLRDGALEQLVLQALADTGLPPGCLELELTESVLIEDEQRPLTVLRRLKAQGVRLSIDDFGTGWSSLSYLRRFQVDKLKIDRSFIRDMLFDPEDRAIVEAIIQIARTLRIRTVAEGVEDAALAGELRRMGCDELQGYYYARPLPAAAFAAWMREPLPVDPDSPAGTGRA